jgi:phosphodiesterase/alkaline phosphatase D-like protein
VADTDREARARLVRETWVRWASRQRRPKKSWLIGWDDLDAGQREVDMLIGDAIYEDTLSKVMGDLPKLQAERDQVARVVAELREFEREYRARLKAYHQERIDELDGVVRG